MPIHDWTREDAGTFHNFHQSWAIRILDALNAGRLPPDYLALTDQRVEGWEPDVISLLSHSSPGSSPRAGGVAVAEHPPQARRMTRRETEAGAYARRANPVVVKHKKGNVVAVIEIVSPGNKDREHSVSRFVEKVRDFLRKGVHVLFVDLFPPGDHDPQGLDAAVWSVWSDTPDDRPADKPLSAVSYDAGSPFVSYVEPLAVGDPLPAMPLFLQPGVYVPCPLEETYQATWAALPAVIREGLELPTL